MDMFTSPFDIPQIILPKLTPEEFLEYLREKLNKGYMSSSTRTDYNSKPEYCRNVSKWASLESTYFPGTGVYAEIDEYGHSIQNASLWCFIDGGTVELACNLGTDETFVRNAADNHGKWYIYDKPVTVDTKVFEEKLEYL